MGLSFLTKFSTHLLSQKRRLFRPIFFHLTPSLKKKSEKKRTLTIVYGENVRWQVISGALIKKGQLLGEVFAQKPLFPKDPANLAFIFSDYRGNDAQVDPKNFSQFFNLDQ